MHSVNITPEMKESVMEGQTMFRISDKVDFSTMTPREIFLATSMAKAAEHENDYNLMKMAIHDSNYAIREFLKQYRNGRRVYQDPTAAAYLKEYDDMMARYKDATEAEREAARDAFAKSEKGKYLYKYGLLSARGSFDLATAMDMTELVNLFIRSGWITGEDKAALKSAIATIKNSLGKEDITEQMDALFQAVTRSNMKHVMEKYNALAGIKTRKIDDSRIARMGRVGVMAQITMKEYNDALDKKLDAETITGLMGQYQDKIDALPDGEEKDRLNAQYHGLEIAKRYLDEVVPVEANMKLIQNDIDGTRTVFASLSDTAEKACKAALRKKLTGVQIDEMMNEKQDQVNGMQPSKRRDALRAEIEGLWIARKYAGEDKDEYDMRYVLAEVDDAVSHLKDLSEENRTEIKEARKHMADLQDEMHQARLNMIDAMTHVNDELAAVIGEGQKAAKNFREQEKEHKQMIYHIWNSDNLDRNVDSQYKRPKVMEKVHQFLASPVIYKPAQTLNSMLKLFGRYYPDGQGKLYDYFMGKWYDASKNEADGLVDAQTQIELKVEEIFGRKVKNIEDLNELILKMPKVKVRYFDTSSKREMDMEMHQGQLAYVYSVAKMADGRMKLDRMGITEDKVAQITEMLDPRIREMMDWFQGEFLPSRRPKYNAVHERMFGTPMAEVEDYFPLRLLKGGFNANIDLMKDQGDEGRIGTTTGAIKTRTRNNSPIDLSTNAFDLAMSNVRQMEHWAAFAELCKDVNILLNNPRVQMVCRNMTSVYGTGDQLFQNLQDAFKMALGYYKRPGGYTSKVAANISRSVAVSKIAFRGFTAAKQILSRPAFWTEVATDPLFAWEYWKSLGPVHRGMSYKWCYDNLSLFRKRVDSRKSGDTQLAFDEDRFDWQKNKHIKKWEQAGMWMNMQVDALTCAMGAHAAYVAKKAKYIRNGMDEAAAERRAKRDAEILYNESQQSSEGAFVSTVQMNKDFLDMAISMYNNSSMGYQRRFLEHAHGLARQIKYHDIMIERMASKAMSDFGMDQVDANKYAHNEYRKQFARNTVGLAIFGYVIQFAWRMAAYAPYLIFGDDPEEKKRMLKKAAMGGCFSQPVRGTLIGKAAEAAMDSWYDGDPWNMLSILDLTSETPYESDLKLLIERFQNDKTTEALVSMGGWLSSWATGIDVRNFSNMALAFVEAANGDPEITQEGLMCVLRVLNCPQSALDQLYIDELGANAGELRAQLEALDKAADDEKQTAFYTQLANRYCNYRAEYSTSMIQRGEKEQEKYDKASRKRFDQKVVDRAKNEYFDEYNDLIKQLDDETSAFRKEMADMTRYERAGLVGTPKYEVYRKIIDPEGNGIRSKRVKYGPKKGDTITIFDNNTDNLISGKNKPKPYIEYTQDDIDMVKDLLQQWQQVKNL